MRFAQICCFMLSLTDDAPLLSCALDHTRRMLDRHTAGILTGQGTPLGVSKPEQQRGTSEWKTRSIAKER